MVFKCAFTRTTMDVLNCKCSKVVQQRGVVGSAGTDLLYSYWLCFRREVSVCVDACISTCLVMKASPPTSRALVYRGDLHHQKTEGQQEHEPLTDTEPVEVSFSRLLSQRRSKQWS